MDSAFTQQLVVTLMLLVLYPKVESQWMSHKPLRPVNPPPLCASQFVLVNHACGLLPFKTVPPPSPPTPPSLDPGPPTSEEREVSHHHRQRHGHDHRQEHVHRHHHGHRHSRHQHQETQAEADCCYWLKSVDNECVCDMLLHLPLFLTWPVHNYTVVADESCSVTFRCGSRLIKR